MRQVSTALAWVRAKASADDLLASVSGRPVQLLVTAPRYKVWPLASDPGQPPCCRSQTKCRQQSRTIMTRFKKP